MPLYPIHFLTLKEMQTNFIRNRIRQFSLGYVCFVNIPRICYSNPFIAHSWAELKIRHIFME